MSTLNNGLKSFYLDGKPVRRASLGGKVFYEKHDYELSLVSDMDILSFYDGDIATLTATLTDYGEPVSGETCFICDSNVEFIKNTANRSYISLKCDGDGTITLATNCDFQVYDSDGNFLYYGHISEGTTTWTLSGTTLTASNWAPKTRELPSNGFILYVKMYDDINNAVSNDSYNHFYYFGVTDSNGECSVSYESKGTGDLNIKCKVPHRSLVSETYEVTDAIKVLFKGDETFGIYPNRQYANNYTINNGLFTGTFRSGGGLLSDFTFQATSDWECTFKFKLSSNDAGRMGITSADANNIERNYFGIRSRYGKMEIACSPNQSTDTMIDKSYNSNVEYDMKLINTNGNLTIYINNTLVSTVNNVEWVNRPLYLYIQSWSSGTVTMRDFIFKAL